jgi:hypothetical protein
VRHIDGVGVVYSVTQLGGFHKDCSRRLMMAFFEKPKHVDGLDGCDNWFIALVLTTQLDESH